MVWIYRRFLIFFLFVRGSTLDVMIYRRRILTFKDGPGAEKVISQYCAAVFDQT